MFVPTDCPPIFVDLVKTIFSVTLRILTKEYKLAIVRLDRERQDYNRSPEKCDKKLM